MYDAADHWSDQEHETTWNAKSRRWRRKRKRVDAPAPPRPAVDARQPVVRRQPPEQNEPPIGETSVNPAPAAPGPPPLPTVQPAAPGAGDVPAPGLAPGRVDTGNYPAVPPAFGTFPEDEVEGFMYPVTMPKVRGPSGPEHVREFVADVENWVDLLVVRQKRPEDGLCQRCTGRNKGPADWRCVCCFKRRDMCASCIRRDHDDLPFHRVYWWTGRNYRRSWLREAGVAIYLCPRARHGHPCPHNHSGFQEEIGARVPSGLRDRRRDKGKGRADAGAPGARRAGAAGAAGADQDVQMSDVPEVVSVPRGPISLQDMDVDEQPEPARTDEPDDSDIPEIPDKDLDFDSELRMLYAAFDAQLRPEDWEAEEQPGGTDDMEHAPERETRDNATGAAPAPGAGPQAPPGAPDAPQPPKARGHAAIPDYDLHGFPVLVLVHDNGVHGIGVNFCRCEDHRPEYEQLLVNGLFPASTRSPATAYCVNSLEKALVENVECRTTTEAYWKKVARLSNPDDPTSTVDRYAITTRVHREFRACREYTAFGFAHQDPANRQPPKEGQMAHSCVACPTESNIPAKFEELPEEEKVFYVHAWALDGNMKAEHTKSRRPQNNVQIFPGAGFFPDPDDFAEKSKKPMTDKSLPPDITRGKELCHRHTAAGGVSIKEDRSKDIRGILSICCARHGLMLPGATVNIPFAENQWQADYALNRSMRINLSRRFSRRLLLGYDIWCQYGVHLLERFRRNPHLEWPDYLEELTGVVGAWHIFAHIRECFGRNSGLYVWGIGIIEMEILETLWSLLNMVTQATRNMSRANREETINFHMNDMNLKKTRAMVTTIVKKWKKQTSIRNTREELLDSLNKSCTAASRARWQEELTEVYRRRSINLSHPELYNPKHMDKFLKSKFIAPDRKATETALVDRETKDTDEPGLVKFVAYGLSLQIEQLTWQAFEKNNTPLSAANKRKLTVARSSLKTRIAKHNKQAIDLLGPRSDDGSEFEDDMLFDAGVRLGDLMSTDEWATGSSRKSRERIGREPEFYGVDLPSSRRMPLKSEAQARAGAYEIVLRVAWMEELLHEICLALVAQVEIFRRTIKKTPGQGPMTQRERVQSKNNMLEQYDTVRLYAQQYNVFRAKMLSITPAPGHCGHPEYTVSETVRRGRFQELTKKDIRCNTKAYDPLSIGTFQLPWFWKLNARDNTVSDEDYIQDFFRIRWINARAGLDRSNEEMGVLRVEMGLVHRGYRALAWVWQQRAELMEGLNDHDTHAFLAWEQEEIWADYADRAYFEFNKLVPGVTSMHD